MPLHALGCALIAWSLSMLMPLLISLVLYMEGKDVLAVKIIKFASIFALIPAVGVFLLNV